jgi:hypothetical protein
MTGHEAGRQRDGRRPAGDLRVRRDRGPVHLRGLRQPSAVARPAAVGAGPGPVARCPHCDDVVLRLVRAPDRVFLDLRGAVSLLFEVPPVGAPAEGDATSAASVAKVTAQALAQAPGARRRGDPVAPDRAAVGAVGRDRPMGWS